MLQLIKYRMICLFRDKGTLFWILLFPLLLATFFQAAFGNLDGTIDTIQTAAVEKSDSEDAKMFGEFLEEFADTQDDLIHVRIMSQKEADKKLEKGTIKGIFYIDEEPRLEVADSGIEESVLQTILSTYTGKQSVIKTLLKEKPEQVESYLASLSEKTSTQSHVAHVSLGGKTEDGMIQYYFALVAMACLFAANLGKEVVVKLQANISSIAARRCAGATNKMKMILADLFTVGALSIFSILILFTYLIGILGMDFGDDYGKLLLVGVFGCFIGLSIGVFVGSVGKWGEGLKDGIINAITLGSSFLSGLMLGGIKGLIEENCPIINRVNPASLITDALYSIAVYPDADRFGTDIMIMGVMAVVCLVGSFLILRRVRYDSI